MTWHDMTWCDIIWHDMMLQYAPGSAGNGFCPPSFDRMPGWSKPSVSSTDSAVDWRQSRYASGTSTLCYGLYEYSAPFAHPWFLFDPSWFEVNAHPPNGGRRNILATDMFRSSASVTEQWNRPPSALVHWSSLDCQIWLNIHDFTTPRVVPQRMLVSARCNGYNMIQWTRHSASSLKPKLFGRLIAFLKIWGCGNDRANQCDNNKSSNDVSHVHTLFWSWVPFRNPARCSLSEPAVVSGQFHPRPLHASKRWDTSYGEQIQQVAKI